MKIKISLSSDKIEAKGQIGFNKRLIATHNQHHEHHCAKANSHKAAGNTIKHMFHKHLAQYHASRAKNLEHENHVLARNNGLLKKKPDISYIGWKRSGSPAYSSNISTSAGHGKRTARLRTAIQQQKQHHKISDFVRMLEDSAFDKYYRGQFQAYLKGKRDVDSSGDKDSNEQAYLDVVSFLHSLLEKYGPNQGVTEDRSKISFKRHRNNSRLGQRVGITYTDTGNPKDL